MIGFYNILKPTGVSSGFVVNKIKRITNEKVGHLGTLDPSASGVLSIAVGKATKFFDYFLNKDKEYIALAKFGVLTNTLDSDGEILKREDVQVSLEDIKKVLPSLCGKIDQIPPIFSSKNVNGERAYDLARQGKQVVLEPKKVQIYSIKAEKLTQNNLFRIKIHCSSGTYVRSIIRDIAEKIGTVATTVCIIRTCSGKFEISDSITLDELAENPEKHLIKINSILNLPEIELSLLQAKDLFSGKEIMLDRDDGEYLSFYQGEEFSVLKIENKKATNKIFLSKESFYG
mgnify:FL=1